MAYQELKRRIGILTLGNSDYDFKLKHINEYILTRISIKKLQIHDIYYNLTVHF
jgi:hypothetical protein